MTNMQDNPLFWSNAAKLKKQQEVMEEKQNPPKNNQTSDGDTQSVTLDRNEQVAIDPKLGIHLIRKDLNENNSSSQHSITSPVSGNEPNKAVIDNPVPPNTPATTKGSASSVLSTQHDAKQIKKSDRKQHSFHLWSSERNKLHRLCLLLNTEEDLVERSELVGLGIDLVDELFKKIHLPKRAKIRDIRESINSQLPGYQLPVYLDEQEVHSDG